MADNQPAALPSDDDDDNNHLPQLQAIFGPLTAAPAAGNMAAEQWQNPAGINFTSNNITPTPSSSGQPYPVALRPWTYRTRYSTQDVRSVWVKPVSGYQSIEQRFGPDARKLIYENLQGYSFDGDQDFFTEQETFDNYSSDDGDDDDDIGHGNTNGEGSSATFDHENDSDDDEEMQDHDYQGQDEEVSEASTTNDSPSNGTPQPMSDADALANAFLSLNGGPLHATGGQPIAPNPHAQQPPPAQTAQTAQPAQQAGPGWNRTRTKRPFPIVARARLNLTALSQRYNLYFAVYQAEIHVFRPQPAPEILHGPLLVLKPPPTAAGRQLGGHMSKTFPHQANHVIIGDLGGIEILLLAYDDGDVVAYYTHHILAHIECQLKPRQDQQPSKRVPQPFFRETVGATAWGLAVHSQSRLIAVSSNLREVNVFAFALQPPRADDPLQHKTQPLVVPNDDLSPTTYSGASALELESLLRLRDRYWRILLPIGLSGHNIPSIDFISDPDGLAEKVAAADILGNIHIMDIWKVGSRPLKISSPSKSGMNTAWGVMVLPIKMCLPTSRMAALSDKNVFNRYNFPNIDGTFYFSYLNDPARKKPKHVPDAYDITAMESDEDDSDASDSDGNMDQNMEDSSLYESGYETERSSDEDEDGHGRRNHGQHEDGEYIYFSEDDDDDSIDDTHARTESTHGSFTYDPATMSRHWDALAKMKRIMPPGAHDSLDLKKDAESPFHLGMIICPSIGVTWGNNNLQALIRTLKNSAWRSEHSREENLYQFKAPQSKEVLDMARRFLIIRTYSQTVELLRTDRSTTPFYIQNVVKPPSRLPFTLWDMNHDFYRCSLLHCIPEINLVLIGNMFGRVILLRPLRNQPTARSSGPAGAPPYAFRVEWTLPLANDERLGLRPPCCLLGMAVSPVPEPGSGRFGMKKTRKPGSQTNRTRRWRLILHYMDHTIFQYYIEGTKPGVQKVNVRAY